MADEDPEIPVFELGQDGAAEDPFDYQDDELNLVAVFKKNGEGRAALKRIADKCWSDFEAAWRATEAFRTNMADTWKLFAGTLDPKHPMFKDLSNAHVPLLMENTVRMVNRQSYELFGNWTQVFGVTPLGPDDEHTAKLLSLHGNWQLRKRIPDFRRQMDRGLLNFDLFGDFACHTYWDVERRINRHEVLTSNEFVCANAHVSTMPDYSDVSWLAKINFMDAHELRKMEEIWEDVGDVLKLIPANYEDPDLEQPLRDAVDKNLGVDSTEFRHGQWQIIQYEGWLNLPGQDRDRYCQVLFDKQTKRVVALNIHERTDPFDKQRFEFQTQQLDLWRQAIQAREQLVMEQQQTQQSAMGLAGDLDPAGEGPTQAVMMARSIGEMELPPEPPMPDWMAGNPMAEPAPPASEPIRMFVHFVNIEPIVGILGLGTGRIHADQNRAANIALSMFIDQGTLGNMKNFIMSGDVRLEGGGTFKVAPGKIHKLIGGGTDISKSLMPLDFGQANPQLLQVVEMMTKFGNSVSNTPEVLSGESGKSGETAQGISSRIEQATKMLSVPTGKYAHGLTFVLINNAKLNATFLDESEFFAVNNHDPELKAVGMQQFRVGREMYDRPYDVEISADLKFTSTAQRIAEADALVQLPNAVPELAGNGAFKYAVIRKTLEARNRYDLIPLLGQPPPPPAVFGLPTSPPAPPPGQPPPGAPPGGQAPPGGGGGQQSAQAPTAAGQQQRGTPPGRAA